MVIEEVVINVRKLHSLYSLSAPNIKSFVVNKIQTRHISTIDTKIDEKFAITADESYASLLFEKEREIESKRNKSRLNSQHQNLIHGKIPYEESMADSHITFKYKKMMFGRYGKASSIDPGTLWPTKSEINETIEYENIAYPFSFKQLVDKQKQIREEEENHINERQQKIIKNLEKLNTWKKEITMRSEKKLADIAKAKAKKDALIEEVRRHFGYNVDQKDEKFKEMLLMKERAQKKKLKEEKSKIKQDRLISELMKKEDK